MALRILSDKLFTFNIQKGANAMLKHKVVISQKESKLPTVPIGESLFDLQELMQGMAIDMEAFATSAGFHVMKEFIDQEVKARAGELHSQATDVNRWGYQRGSVVVGAQRKSIRLQRLRTREGREVPLSSYQAFRRKDPRTEAIYKRLLAGVSCRDYAGTVEAVADGYGISRSVASRGMIEATAKNLKELVERDLSGWEIVVLLIDGIRLADEVMIVAEGVDSTGKKHILGFREGATENARVCIDLLQDLFKRGLKMDHPMLIVLDGSSALRSAVEEVIDDNAIVQRCQQHKRENVKKYLPQKFHAEVERKLKAAYAMTSFEHSYEALRLLVRELTHINVSAANSLTEGLEETIAINRLQLPEVLRKSFSTTNLLESPFSNGRRVMRNVKRWQTSEQRHRWTATALLTTERRFRKIHGYRLMPALINALRTEVDRRRQQNKVNVA
jgi:transposase-like protein